ncbi:protein kinase [Actinomadura sp. 7K507]|uniref:protein kinase n=1 Tax=Actinomadura sp. 7K507 TaxID=2530365 RepID=UPI001049993F|nr:protein kinase [Actinomadura sp. 7K507]TDC96567.1 protein kinase [Actinomadura sp. 7K507]
MSDLPGPAGLAEVLSPHTGVITGIEATERGHSSDVTALVSSEAGRWFVKAVRDRPGGRRDSLVREGLVNPHVQPISPAVLWKAESSEWLALGFEVVDGRPSVFEPGSPDMSAVVDVLGRISALPLPDVAAGWQETRWDRHTDRPELLQGDTLLYTDIQPDNILIGDQAVWAVDWAWPTRGAAFIDPALLVVQLIATGYRAEAAEGVVAGCSAWTGADPEALDEFAAANARMQVGFARRYPDVAWMQAMADAAQEWADWRLGDGSPNCPAQAPPGIT